MNNETIVDEDHENQASSSLLPTNQHASHSELVTKIYYPDSLYPDNYSFFADRGNTPLSKAKSSLPMDTTIQYPTKTVDQTDPPTVISIVSKQATTEIETIDQPRKYSSPMIDRERVESESEKRRFDVKRYIPTALRAQDKNQPPGILLDPRFYSMKKTAMTIMCLLIIIMSNSVQLKHVLTQGRTHSFYGTQVTLGIISVLMCASIARYKQILTKKKTTNIMSVIFACFFILAGFYLMYMLTINDQNTYKQRKIDFLQNLGLIFLFSLFILNIIYTIFHAI
ncbi:unnamed protein product [Rotaria sp. Silwood2]|nr:unnamed protein product [Rotaria sp. Silwood2]CAF2499297.1 unnamed protein product [Rotaria sp. Silwood2]CAF2896890.1 unnamed protein product [Rotaria sp. Silwood2]CAF3933750.1 unnamed protein product [Rotaria sp. Silwood2]CAF3992806.1 unnamed protein product [Rotaria sp. Silwood2]